MIVIPDDEIYNTIEQTPLCMLTKGKSISYFAYIFLNRHLGLQEAKILNLVILPSSAIIGEPLSNDCPSVCNTEASFIFFDVSQRAFFSKVTREYGKGDETASRK